MQVLSTQFYDYIAQVTDLCKIRDLLALTIFKPRKALYFLTLLLFSVKLSNRMFRDSWLLQKALCTCCMVSSEAHHFSNHFDTAALT